jgi:hypothetical protein
VRRHHHQDETPYVAKHAIIQALVLACFACFSGWLVVFSLISGQKSAFLLVLLGMCIFMAYMSVRFISSRVMFTGECIQADRYWFRHLSQPWSAVTEIHVVDRSVRVVFSDGSSLTIWKGLGDS